MIEDFVEASFDQFVGLCNSGMWHGVQKCEPNSGKFNKEFVVEFIESLFGGYYHDDISAKIQNGCVESLLDLETFSILMKDKIIDYFETDESLLESDRSLIYSICDSFDEIINTLNKSSNKSLYSEIENSIIRWNNDGSKTAGHLTRQIMTLINSNITDSLPSNDEIKEAANKWVFEDNGHRWSNNNNECGDNSDSFISGAKWLTEKLKNNKID